MNAKPFKIGTRSSPLALTQAHMLADALQVAHPDLLIEIIPMKSAADWHKGEAEQPLSEENGGKGQFAKEIEEALLRGEIDCGVHSMKDMAAFLPDGLVIRHVLPRADARDAFISEKYHSINDLPQGAVVGTCSVRRQALLLAQRPDVKVVPFRGNVQTRLDKVKAGQVDATFLAMAGLTRLNIVSEMIKPIEKSHMLPACGQGVVCMEIREDDAHASLILGAVNCLETELCAAAEREVLKLLDGSCHTPIGAHATFNDRTLSLDVIVASLDGTQIYEDTITIEECCDLQSAVAAGHEVGQRLLSVVPKDILV